MPSMIDKRIQWPGWEIVGLIGRGSFGSVYKIQRDVFGEVEEGALKVISIPQNEGDIEEMYSDGYDSESITSTFQSHLKSIVAEYSLMRKMNSCTNIVHCDDIRYIHHDDGIGWDIFIKMELLTPLTKALPAEISEDLVIKLGTDMCTALEACNEYGIIHRDIKPQNIFVSKYGDYKLGDFGIAKTVEKTMGGTKIGTYKYMAPEVYNNQPYGTGADIYSLGLVLYWLLNDRRMPFMPPPPKKMEHGMEEASRHRRFSGEPLPPPAHGSDELKQIVLKACAFDPKERFSSAAEMLAALKALSGEGVGGSGRASEPGSEPGSETSAEDKAKQKSKKPLFAALIAAVVVVIVLLVLLLKGCSGDGAQSGGQNQNSSSTESSSAVSSEPEIIPVVVSDVIGMSEGQAVQILEDSGLAVRIVQIESSQDQQGMVIEQIPASNEMLDPGSVVTLSVGNGSAPITVANVVGMTAEQAKASLEAQGFAVSVSEVESNQANKGMVVSQDPPAESSLAPGGNITIAIGDGNAPVAVADVVGMTERDAKETLESQGFTVKVKEVTSAQVAAGCVVSQDPQANTNQAYGATITISVCTGSPSLKVSLDANGGSVDSSSITVKTGATYGSMPTPSRKGYSFTGWYTSASGGNKVTSDTEVTSSTSHTLYAHWTAKEFKVSFDANGGSVSTSSVTVTYGSTYGTLPTPTRNGYSFVGWYTEPSNGKQITSGTTVSITSNQTLYALWSQSSCTVTFDANGGSSNVSSKSYECGSQYGSLPTPTRTGFNFTGWYDSSTGTKIDSNSTVPASKSCTLTAKWSVLTYSATWDNGTGYSISVNRVSSPYGNASTGTLNSGATVYYGDVLSISYTANTGYSLSTNGSTSITVTGNVTSSNIYAKASANSYTYNIVYVSVNGTALGTATVTNEYGSTNTISPKSFSGYNSPSSQSVKWDSTSAKTITFTYSPSSVGTTTKSGNVYSYSYSKLAYNVTMEYRNRTANSVQVRVTWTATLSGTNAYNNYAQCFKASSGSASTGVITVVKQGAWGSKSSSTRTATASSGWITVSLNTTSATTVSLNVYYYQANANGTDMTNYSGANTDCVSATWKVNVPAH